MRPVQAKIKINLKLLPDDVMLALKSGWKENTVKSTLTSIMRVCKLAFNTEQFILDQFLKEQDVLIRALGTVDKQTVRRTLLGDVLRVMTLMGAQANQVERLTKLMMEWKSVGTVIATPEEIELANQMPCSEVEDKRQQLKEIAERTQANDCWHEYLLLSLYLDIFPQRQSALAITEIVRFDVQPTDADLSAMVTKDRPNFFCLNNQKLVITKYKTDQKGITVFNFPQKLCDIISVCHDKFKFKYLIPLKSDGSKPMLASGVTHQLNKLLGNKIASNMLRKITASEVCPTMTDAERNALAHQAGHSTNAQTNSYMRYADTFTMKNPC